MTNKISSKSIVVGLTGGIACGKSTVSRTLIKMGVPVVDADKLSREVVTIGSSGLHQIINTFGKDFLLEDGTLNRNKLANLVFNNSQALEKINAIMAPLIENESNRQIEKLKLTNSIVVYDAALIIEMGNADKYRPLIVVHCPQEIQLNRLMKRNNLSKEDAMARINAQIPVEKKKELADFTIDTSQSIDFNIEQTVKIYETLISKVWI